MLMDIALLQPLLHWLSAHPTLAGLTVFAIAMGESLAIVGLFVPGVVLMFGIGALVSTGAMDLAATLAWAFAGAVTGDGLSYWLGRRYHGQLRGRWPFRSRPGLLNRGEAFFRRHGGKSVLLGRFVGPIRPVIPLVAGMLDMPAPRFFLVNILSALAWAPAYLLPGVIFGASLDLAAEVATRLAVVLVAAVAALWLSGWLVRRVFLFLQPRAGRIIDRALAWSDRHPALGHLTAALVDPRHPESRALLLFAVVLVTAGWVFVWVLAEVAGGMELAALNDRVYHLAQGLRTPWADRVLVVITELGDAEVLTALLLGVAAWLGLQRHWLALGHWLGAGLFAALVPTLMKWAVQEPRPAAAAVDGFSFPSGHTTASMVILGFLAVLVARELPPARRWIAYVAGGLSALAIALSRLYLGVHWFSDVLGGMALGLAWVALLGIAYRRHPAPALSLTGLVTVSTLVLGVAGLWHVERSLAGDLQTYAPRHPVRTATAADWWAGRLTGLPRYRIDIEGLPEHPLTLQWAGGLTAIRGRLTAHGWHAAPDTGIGTPLRWLIPAPAIDQLPVLPQVHDGRHGELVMIRDLDHDRRRVLRLWPADVVLQPGAIPLWVGNVATQYADRTLPLFTVARTEADFATPVAALARELVDVELFWAQPPGGDGPPLLRLRGSALTAPNGAE